MMPSEHDSVSFIITKSNLKTAVAKKVEKMYIIFNITTRTITFHPASLMSYEWNGVNTILWFGTTSGKIDRQKAERRVREVLQYAQGKSPDDVIRSRV